MQKAISAAHADRLSLTTRPYTPQGRRLRRHPRTVVLMPGRNHREIVRQVHGEHPEGVLVWARPLWSEGSLRLTGTVEDWQAFHHQLLWYPGRTCWLEYAAQGLARARPASLSSFLLLARRTLWQPARLTEPGRMRTRPGRAQVWQPLNRHGRCARTSQLCPGIVLLCRGVNGSPRESPCSR